MRVVKEKIGETTILIQTINEPLDIIGERGRHTLTTGIGEEAKEVYRKVKSVITDIAKDVSTDMRRIGKADRPQSLEIECNIGVSAEAGPVFLVGGGEASFKVKMIWNFENDGENLQD